MPIDLATDNSPSPEHRPDLKKSSTRGCARLAAGSGDRRAQPVEARPDPPYPCSQNEQGKQTLFRKMGLHLCHGRFLSEADVSVADFAPPAPAALLYRNWL